MNKSDAFYYSKDLIYDDSNYDDLPTEASQFWTDRANYGQGKNFIIAVLISCSPFLVFLLILIFVSCTVTNIQRYKKKRSFEKKIKQINLLNDFMDLHKYDSSSEISKNESTGSTSDSSSSSDQKHIKRRRTGLNDLKIPDENKVPIVLVNEIIAKSNNPERKFLPNFYLSDEDEANIDVPANIQIDEDIINVINELVNPNIIKEDTNSINSNTKLAESRPITSKLASSLRNSFIGSILNLDQTPEDNPVNSPSVIGTKRKSSALLNVANRDNIEIKSDQRKVSSFSNILQNGVTSNMLTVSNEKYLNTNSDKEQKKILKVERDNKINVSTISNKPFPDIQIYVEDYDEKHNDNKSQESRMSENASDKEKSSIKFTLSS